MTPAPGHTQTGLHDLGALRRLHEQAQRREDTAWVRFMAAYQQGEPEHGVLAQEWEALYKQANELGRRLVEAYRAHTHGKPQSDTCAICGGRLGDIPVALLDSGTWGCQGCQESDDPWTVARRGILRYGA